MEKTGIADKLIKIYVHAKFFVYINKLFDNIKNFSIRFDKYVKKLNFLFLFRVINRKLDRLLRKRVNIMPPKPCLFPLRSIQDVIDFNNISEEEYEIAVSFLILKK